MHALHGNGTTLGSVHDAVRDELGAYVDELGASGTLEDWLNDDATVRPQAQQSIGLIVRPRQRKSQGCTPADALKSLLVQKLEQLAQTARVAEGTDLDLAVVHFLTLLWTTNLPPFYYLLTWASRQGLKPRLERTFHYLHWALQQIEAPTVLAATRACRDVACAPLPPPGGALLVWRGLPDESLLTGFKDDVRAGCLTAFSLSPSVARLFGNVLVCVEVSEADFSCFAHLVTVNMAHEAEALLHRPCELTALDDDPLVMQSRHSWTNWCYRLRRLDEGGAAGAAGAAAADVTAEAEAKAAAAEAEAKAAVAEAEAAAEAVAAAAAEAAEVAAAAAAAAAAAVEVAAAAEAKAAAAAAAEAAAATAKALAERASASKASGTAPKSRKGPPSGIDPLGDGHISGRLSRVRKQPSPGPAPNKAPRTLFPNESTKATKVSGCKKSLSGSQKRQRQERYARWAASLTLADAQKCKVVGTPSAPMVQRPAAPSWASAKAGDEEEEEDQGDAVSYKALRPHFAPDVQAYFEAIVRALPSAKKKSGGRAKQTARWEAWAAGLTLADAEKCEVRLDTKAQRPEHRVWRPHEKEKGVPYEAVKGRFAADVEEHFASEVRRALPLGAVKEHRAADQNKRKNERDLRNRVTANDRRRERRLRERVTANEKGGRTRRAQAVRLQQEAARTARAHLARTRPLLPRPEGRASAQSCPLEMLDLVNNIAGAQMVHPTEALRHEDVQNPDPQKLREVIRMLERDVHVFPEEKMQVVQEVLSVVARDAPFPSCTVCGVRDLTQPCTDMVLTAALAERLRLSESKSELVHALGAVTLYELDKDGTNLHALPTAACDISHLVSFVEFNDERYALHEEHVQRRLARETDPQDRIVDGDGNVLEFQVDKGCRAALTAGRLPALCLPQGHDFGRLTHKSVRMYLPPPSDAEKLALAPVRLYGLVAKVVAPGQESTPKECLSSKLEGHFISFPQAGPSALAQEVDVLAQLGSLHEALRAVFVGPEGLKDVLLGRLKKCRNLQLRAAALWNYLTVLHLVSEHEQRRADGEEGPAPDDDDDEPVARGRGGETAKSRRMPNVTGAIPALARVELACESAWSTIAANARHVTEMRTDLAARVKANDVAGVRAKGADEGASAEEEEEAAGEEDSMTVEKVALLERGRAGSAELEAAKVKAIADKTVKIARGPKPLSEFSNNAALLTNAFWWLFPLSGHWLPAGSLTVKATKHILLQHTATAARDADFVLMIGDQRLRHSNASAVNAKMRASPQAWSAYHAAVSHPNFVGLCEAAASNPTGPESDKLQKKVLPFLQICAAQQPWSAAERRACISDLWAMARRFGVASIFWTIAFDDVHDPRVMRLSMRAPRNAQQSQAMVQTFARKLYEGNADGYDILCKERPAQGADGGADDDGEAVEAEFRCSEEFMQSAAASNPVATSMVYDSLLRVVMGLLMGTPASDSGMGSSLKTLKLEERAKGIYGKLLASYVVTEVTGKKTKHGHGLGFGGPMPAMLSNIAHFRELVQKHVLPALESHARSTFPTEFHVVDAARNAVERGRGRQTAPYAPQDELHALVDAELCGDLAERTVARELAREAVPDEFVMKPAAELEAPCMSCGADELPAGVLCTCAAVQRFEAELAGASLRTAGTRQSHTWHHKTCHKPPHGDFHCRLGHACGHPTCGALVQLVPRLPTPGKDKKQQLRPPAPTDALDPYSYICQLATCDQAERLDYSVVLPRAPALEPRSICAPPLVGEALEEAAPSRSGKAESEEEEEGEGEDNGDDDDGNNSHGEETVLVEDDDGADARTLGSPLAPVYRPQLGRPLYQPPPGRGGGAPEEGVTPVRPPEGEARVGVVSSRTRSRSALPGRHRLPPPAASEASPSPTSPSSSRAATPQKRGKGERLTFVDPLIPVPEHRLLVVELPRPPTIAEGVRTYDNLLALLAASGHKTTGRVNGVQQIDGPNALRVVVELFREPAIAAVLADEGLTSTALRDAVSEMTDVIDGRPVDDATRKRLEGVAKQIVLAWRRLPCRNAQVAVYSDVLTFLFGCNNNPVHLGASAAAKAAMFYLVKYITKDSVAMNTALSILKDAKKHVDKWKSTAEDAATNPHRPSIQLSERVANSNGGMELADTQMAGVALGHKAHLSSESFVYVSMDMVTHLGQALVDAPSDGETTSASIAALLAAGVDCFGGAASYGAEEEDEEEDEGHDPHKEVFGDGDGDDDDDDDLDDDDDDLTAPPRDAAVEDMDRPNKKRRRNDPEAAPEHGYVEFHTMDGKPVPVAPAMHYLFRGKTLARCNLTELHTCYALEAIDERKFEALAAADAAKGAGLKRKQRPAGDEEEDDDDDDDDGDGETRGRKAAARYLLHSEHPLHTRWAWRALHRLKCPKVGGPRPPMPPKQLGSGERVPRAWLKQQHLFAAFMVACCVPWFSGSAADDEPFLHELAHSGPKPGPPPLTVDVLRAWIAHLSALAWAEVDCDHTRREAHIAQGRLRYMENFVHTLGAGALEKMLSLQHKYRSADKWTLEEREAHTQVSAKDRESKRATEDLRAKLEGREVSPKAVETARKLALLATTCLEGLKALPPPQGGTPTGAAGSRVPTEGAPAGFFSSGRSKDSSKLCTAALAALAAISGAALPALHAGPNLEAGTRGAASSAGDSMPPEFAEVTDGELAKSVQAWQQAKAACAAEGAEPPLPPLNQCQRRFCRRLMPWLFDARRARASDEEGRAEWGPRLAKKHGSVHLLLGAGGTGKTSMLQVLEDVMLRQGFGRIAFLSYMGVAAALLPHGNTLCTGLGMSPAQLASSDGRTTPKQPCTVTKFAKHHGDPAELLAVVFDEASFLSCENLKHASSRIADILDLPALLNSVEVPFGGLLAVVMGDFFQLPPVGARPCYQALVHLRLGGLFLPGKKKRRAPALLGAEMGGARILEKARRFYLRQQMRAPDDAQLADWLQQLRRVDVTYPIPGALLEFLEGQVVKDRSDPAVAFAPSASTGHAETDVLGVLILHEFARHHGLPVIRWAIRLPEEILEFRSESEIAGLFENESAVLYDYFVKGAPAICLANASTSVGATNGTRGFYDSVDLQEGTTKHVQEAADGMPAVITLSKRPHCIGMALQRPTTQAMHIASIMAANASMYPDRCVVPIGVHGPYKRDVHMSSTYAAEAGYPKTFAIRNDSVLPIRHDFTGTDYKYQGCTVRGYFAIFLGRRPCAPHMSICSLYVLISRITHSKRLLVLPYAGDLDHLATKSHPVELRIFEGSYDEDGYLDQQLMEQAALAIEKVDTETKSVARKRRQKAARHRRGKAGAPVRQQPRPPPPAARNPPTAAAGSKRPPSGSASPPGPRKAAKGAAAAQEPASGAPANRRVTVDRFQSCRWHQNSCHVDVTMEIMFAVCLSLGVDMDADFVPRVLGGAIGPAVWPFVQLRAKIHRGQLQNAQCRRVLLDLAGLRNAARQALVEHCADAERCTMSSVGNTAENIEKAVPFHRAAAGKNTRWMRSCLLKVCDCSANRIFMQCSALNFVSMQETDGHIFRAFVGMLRTSWRPCRDCRQAGGLRRGSFPGMEKEEGALPGAAPGRDRDLLALGVREVSLMSAVHVEASTLHTLRVGHACVALMKVVAVVYYDGGHYICDVDLGTDDTDPDATSWYRYDHMKNSAKGGRLPEPPSKDQFMWNGRGPYRVTEVVYRRVKELATSPPCDLSFPDVAHRFEVDTTLACTPRQPVAAPGAVERGAVATQNAIWCRTGQWHAGGADHALEPAPHDVPVTMCRSQGDADAGAAARQEPTRLCVVAAPVACLLRQRVAACAHMASRNVALVSFGSAASPASGYGQGGLGPEEELCRIMPALHGQLAASAAYPLDSGTALVTKTLLCRESGTYAPKHPAVPVIVISTHLGPSDSRGGTAVWHAGLRVGAQTALWAARRSQITDLVLSEEAFGADPALAAEGVATFCDVLRSQEFAGAFQTVVLAARREHEGFASAHLATIDHRSSPIDGTVRVPTDAEAVQLSAELERHLQEVCGWTEQHGQPVDVEELAGAVGPVVGWACDATRLAAAAQVLQRAGKLVLSDTPDSYAKTIERGQPCDMPGISWGVPTYEPAQPDALPGGPSSRSCLILGDAPPSHGPYTTTACLQETHTEGVAGVALREARGHGHEPDFRVAILVAANAGRPGGACRSLSGQFDPAKLHADHETQEEDIVSNWLLCLPEAERQQAFGRISYKWGLKEASGQSPATVQGVDYTSAGAPARVYADAWALGGSGEVVSGGAKSGGAFSMLPEDRVRAQLVFCAAPNSRKPARRADPMARTFSAQAHADRAYFEEGRAWAVYAALIAARDAGSTVVVMPYIGGALYAGPFAREDDLQSTFRAGVNAVLEFGRLPGGAQLEPLGKHFRAVHIVASR